MADRLELGARHATAGGVIARDLLPRPATL